MAGTDRSVNRIIVCNLDSLYSGAGLHMLAEHFEGKIVGICASKRYGPKYGGFLKQFFQNVKRSGPVFVTYLALHLLYYYPMVYVTDLFNAVLRKKKKVYTLGQLSRRYGIPIVRTNEPNNPDTIEWMRSLQPDLIVSAYFDHVIRKDIINLPALGVLNVHTALLPDFRGPFPTLWPLIHGKQKIGVTIHYINNEYLDAGPILKQKILERKPGESVLGMDCRFFRAGMELMIACIHEIERGTAHAVAQDAGEANYYPYPKLADLAALKRFRIPLFTFGDFMRQFV